MRSSNSDVPGLLREAEGQESEVRLKSPASQPASFLSAILPSCLSRFPQLGTLFAKSWEWKLNSSQFLG